MFNKNFYPSPKKVTDLFKEKIGSKYYKYILEPSAGKGDLLNAVKSSEIMHVIELEEELRAILQSKGYDVVGDDFLSYKTFTEYNLIIMNPPFDNGSKHVLKALELAEGQCNTECRVLALINANTLDNAHTKERTYLSNRLAIYGANITYHDDLFKGEDVERSTGVKCALIDVTVSVPKNKAENVFSSVFNDISMHTPHDTVITAVSTFVKQAEVEAYVKNISTLVSLYKAHVEKVKEVYACRDSLVYFNTLLSEYQRGRGSSSYVSPIFSDTKTTFNEELLNVRLYYWGEILQTGEFAGILTSHSRSTLIKQMSGVGTVEITMENIQMLITSLHQNKRQLMVDSCVNLFDKITGYSMNTYSDNVHMYNGWKTNSAFKITPKVILPFSLGWSWTPITDRDMGYTWQTEEYEYDCVSYVIQEKLADFKKMFAMLGVVMGDFVPTDKKGEYENETIRFRIFKKSTMHIWFKDLALLDRFNLVCGREKNWVPHKEDTSKEANEFLKKEFKHITDYTKLLD